jgi:hypothetical protein
VQIDPPGSLFFSKQSQLKNRRYPMTQAFFPIEAVSGLWEIVCFCGTLFVVAMVWILAPR